MDIVAGIDIGGTHTKFGVVNEERELLASGFIPTLPASDYKAFFIKLCKELETCISLIPSGITLTGIGIGAPSGSCITGVIERAVNLDWPDKLPVADILSAWFNVPVVVSNDANAAAYGEMHYGAGIGLKNLICITLGTGLGCGIISGGRLITGINGLAGELGHVTAIPEGRACTCGRKGCLETYVSATGMVRTVQEMSSFKLSRSALGKMELHLLTSKEITDAALEGDELALEVFEYTGKIFGRTLADVVALMNPERIILAGGLAQAGDLLTKPLNHYLDCYMLDMYRGSVDIRVSTSTNNNIQLLGAAAFAWDELDSSEKTRLNTLSR